MNKLDLKTLGLIYENIEKIGDLFPHVIVETEEGKQIDFELLKQELSGAIVSETKEKYQLTWPGKKEAIVVSNTPSTNTLRPIEEKSVNFAKTKNIYIEGDNLEVLKILQESYLNKIKCIYIDPPYNTGNDFIYNDSFDKDKTDELIESGQIDETGNRLIANNESSGRFHSDWLSMMYSRLKLARTLMSDDGVIFISIDDNEQANLKKLCDEIFGERNALNLFTRVTKKSSNNGMHFSPSTDYVLGYAKKIEKLPKFFVPLTTEQKKSYNREDENGAYKEIGLYQAALKHGGSRYYIETPDKTKVITPNDIPWRWNEKRFLEGLKNGEIVFKKTSSSPLITETGTKSEWNIYTKLYLKDREDEGLIPKNYNDNLQNTLGSNDVKKLNIPFDFAKPVELIKYLLNIAQIEKDSIILDFFSGSATTAHAVMQLNAEDGNDRKYIMVQLPEECNENSDAYKTGYKTICEIGEERIRRAGNKIKEETNAEIDYGFRVYKIDTSSMKEIKYEPEKYKQENLKLFETSIKEDRTELDLLTQVILSLGLKLDLSIEEKKLKENKIYIVDKNSLIACFDEEIDIEIVEEISKYNPLKVVFKDISFKNDTAKINLQEKFKKLSPDTEISIL